MEARFEEVLNAVSSELYPPTNPRVLLDAAKAAYAEGRIVELIAVLGWTTQVVVKNSLPVNGETQALYDAGFSLHAGAVAMAGKQ